MRHVPVRERDRVREESRISIAQQRPDVAQPTRHRIEPLRQRASHCEVRAVAVGAEQVALAFRGLIRADQDEMFAVDERGAVVHDQNVRPRGRPFGSEPFIVGTPVRGPVDTGTRQGRR